MARVSLNLLPPDKKKALQTGFVMAYAQAMIFFFFIVAAFVAGTFVSVRILLSNNFAGLAAQSGGAADDADKVASEIKQINSYLKRIDALQTKSAPWSNIMTMVSNAVPGGVILESMTFSAKNGKITMRGIAADRADVLRLRQNLLNLTFMENISNPLSNLLQRKDVHFEFEMYYVPPKADLAPKSSN